MVLIHCHHDVVLNIMYVCMYVCMVYWLPGNLVLIYFHVIRGVFWGTPKGAKISFQMADTVITVSEKDRSSILELSPDTQVYTVGHGISIDESRTTKTAFDQRSGILFIGSFHDSMYYNGDAVWFFLTEVYLLILKESKLPIPFTIAGENVPKDIQPKGLFLTRPSIAQYFTNRKELQDGADLIFEKILQHYKSEIRQRLNNIKIEISEYISCSSFNYLACLITRVQSSQILAV